MLLELWITQVGRSIVLWQSNLYGQRRLKSLPHAMQRRLSVLLPRLWHHIVSGLAPFLVSTAILLQATSQVQAQAARIVGLGATTCHGFSEDVKSNPAIRRDYLAWTQGFMSGILLSRPPGIDEALDLAPSTFDLAQQLGFLEEYCARHDGEDLADAVTALYKRLRQEGKT